MRTPAQSSAIRISVEASIVAVRRGMERQYGKGLSVHRRGRSVRGQGRAGRGRRTRPQAFDICSTGSEPESDFSMASRNRAYPASSVTSPVVRLRAAQLPHIAAPNAAKTGINNQASAAMPTSLPPDTTDWPIRRLTIWKTNARGRGAVTQIGADAPRSGLRSAGADPLLGAVREALVLPDRNLVLEVVDELAGGRERLRAVRAGDRHDDRDVTHPQFT